MYPHQAERLSEALDGAALDALVATSPANVAYVTGFRNVLEPVVEAPQFGVFTRAGSALVVPAIEVPSVVAGAVDADHVVCFGGWRASSSDAPNPEARRLQAMVATAAAGPAEALVAALDRLGVRHGSIGVDESRLTP
jgi:Xaa-Pro aminopeptidase